MSTTATTTYLPSSQQTASAFPLQQQPTPLKRRTMSITQTYFLAHKARAKLSSEAGRPDHNLRLLVGHANLLDTLMLELADAEREQESWFNQSVRVASPAPAAPKTADRHVQWADAIVEEEEPEEPEEPEEDWQADDSDMSSDASSDYSDEDEYDEDEDEIDSASSPETYDDEDCEMVDAAPLRRVASHNSFEVAPTSKTTPTITVDEADADSDVEVDDDEEDYAQLTLTRSPSHSATAAPLSPTSPPELVMEDSDASSEDEALPPSPPTVTIGTFTKKSASAKAQQHKTHTASNQFDDNDRLYLPPRNPARLVSSISVF